MDDMVEQGQDVAVTTRDYVKAFLLIGLIVALIVIGFMLFIISAGCGCTRPPAG